MAWSPETAYEKVVEVVMKKPKYRKDDEVFELLPWFRAKCRLFEKLSSDIVKDIIRNCDFVEVEANTVIIKQGDLGDCFYTLLAGTVSVWINSNISDFEETSNEETVTLTTAISSASLAERISSYTIATDRSKYGNCVATLESGTGFGELALINKDCIRNASIITEEHSDLLVVPRELYNRSLRKPQEEEFKERSNFVNESLYFTAWTKRHKSQLAMSLQRGRLPFGSNVHKQGDPVDGVFFLLNGEAKIVVDNHLHETQYEEFYPLPDPTQHERDQAVERFLTSIGKSVSKNEGSGRSTPTNPMRIRQRSQTFSSSSPRSSTSKSKAIDLCLVEKNEVLGELEVVLDLKTYASTVQCSEASDLYHLNMKNFERLILRKYPKTLNIMHESAFMKIISRTQRLPFNRIPLFTFFKLKFRDMENDISEKKNKSSGKISKDTTDPYAAKQNIEKFSLPPQGCIVDMFGPGTVFYRIRMREEMKKLRNAKQLQIKGEIDSTTSDRKPLTPSTGGNEQVITDNKSQTFAKSNNITTDNISSTSENRINNENNQNETTRNDSTNETSTAIEGSSQWSDEMPVFDWETSDKSLGSLEDKIRSWFERTPSASGTSARVLHLKRFDQMKMDSEGGTLPHPGKKVIMRKKSLLRETAADNQSLQASTPVELSLEQKLAEIKD